MSEPIHCDRCTKIIASNDEDFGDPYTWYEHICGECLKPALAEQEKEANTNVEAQEEVCSALWEFARDLGLDTKDADVSEKVRSALPLRRIVRAYGFTVASIQ
jgi:hypothetical protein